MAKRRGGRARCSVWERETRCPGGISVLAVRATWAITMAGACEVRPYRDRTYVDQRAALRALKRAATRLGLAAALAEDLAQIAAER